MLVPITYGQANQKQLVLALLRKNIWYIHRKGLNSSTAESGNAGKYQLLMVGRA